MTRVLHRAVNRSYPAAESGSGICHSTAPASSISTPAAERRLPALVTAAPTCWRPCRPSSTSWPMRLRASSPPARPRSWRIGSSRTRRPACPRWFFAAVAPRPSGLLEDGAALLCGEAENSLGVASPITASGLGRGPAAGGAGAWPRGRRSACSAGPFGWQCRWPQRRPGLAGTAIHRHGP
jgi:hypothetical protein